jgi:hypothetical protein
MTRFIGIAGLYLAMVVAWTAAGALLLIAPARSGNLLHDQTYLFPEVHAGDWGKKLFLRAVGLGLIAFAVRFLLRLFH